MSYFDDNDDRIINGSRSARARMKHELFKKMYTCEPKATPLPEEGCMIVHSSEEARQRARDLFLSRDQYKFIMYDHQLRGITMPDSRMFYFIHVSVDQQLVKSRIRK